MVDETMRSEAEPDTAARLERDGAERKRVRVAPAVLSVGVNRLLKTMEVLVIYWTSYSCSVSSHLLKIEGCLHLSEKCTEKESVLKVELQARVAMGGTSDTKYKLK